MKRAVRAGWPPLAAWILATTVVAVTAAADGFGPLRPVTWARWDSWQYLGIMTRGYTIVHCHPPQGTLWCGNSGWFGGYPWLVDALRPLGMPAMRTAVVVSWIFSLATMVLLWLALLRHRPILPASGALLFAAFAPGGVYDYALYPISMLVFFVVLHLWLVERERFLAAGLAGAAAASAYPLGLLLAATSAAWILAVPSLGRPRDRLRRATLVAGLTIVGVVPMFIVQRFQVGRWNAYFLVERKFHTTPQNPLSPLVDAVRAIGREGLFTLGNVPQLQMLFVTVVLACVLGELLLRRQATRSDLLVAVWGVGVWLFTQGLAHESFWRGEAALLPVAVLVRRLPLALIVPLVACAIALTIPMTLLYVRSRLL